MRGRMVTILLVAGLGVTALTAGTREGTSARQGMVVHRGCPRGLTGWTVRPALVDDVIAAARKVAIDHISERNQSRVTRRTAENYPVLEVVQLNPGFAIPENEPLMRIAAHRCGRKAAQAAWAVVFSDTESIICCLTDTRFAVHLRNGWWVF